MDCQQTVEPFRTIVADPPWPFQDSLPGPKRGASKFYKLMDVEDICNFELPPIADDARLFLWRVASQQEAALRVAKAWGFKVKSEIVWVKMDRYLRRIPIGMGRQVRMAHEICLIATRGKPERLSASIPSVYFAVKGKHSEKPVGFHQLVEELSPGPYLEVFARTRPSGWYAIGDELPDSERLKW